MSSEFVDDSEDDCREDEELLQESSTVHTAASGLQIPPGRIDPGSNKHDPNPAHSIASQRLKSPTPQLPHAEHSGDGSTVHCTLDCEDDPPPHCAKHSSREGNGFAQDPNGLH
ncbi:MAG: hypothetical protein Q7R81_05380 [Candidatus Peregrinibacteria bacterium]|nr:hypothetical protein [Candidatus Peregrinibacteria bacterium]